MAFVAADMDGSEWIFKDKPYKSFIMWKGGNGKGMHIELPKGTIEKLIGKKLTWEDEPVELKEKENEKLL